MGVTEIKEKLNLGDKVTVKDNIITRESTEAERDAKAELDKSKADAAKLNKEDYTDSTWKVLVKALNMKENTEAEMKAKKVAIDKAIESLEPSDAAKEKEIKAAVEAAEEKAEEAKDLIEELDYNSNASKGKMEDAIEAAEEAIEAAKEKAGEKASELLEDAEAAVEAAKEALEDLKNFSKMTLSVKSRKKDEDSETDKGGVIVTFGFENTSFKLKDLEGLKITLYNGSTKLATNVLQDADKQGDYAESNKNIDCPFNFGTKGNSEWSWDRGAYPVGETLSDENLPTKAVLEIKIYGTTFEIVEDSLSFDVDNFQ